MWGHEQAWAQLSASDLIPSQRLSIPDTGAKLVQVSHSLQGSERFAFFPEKSKLIPESLGQARGRPARKAAQPWVTEELGVA